ncbi:MAG: tyrosine-protein phosphatase [Clostridia bacterium]|nr:tyrosine-protein phosphatase [Clostridia bacterium]
MAKIQNEVGITTLRLKKLNNTRDLGGLPTKDGRVVKYGKLIRSGKLFKLPEKTIARLHQIGVTKIVDLRIDTEIGEYPDTMIPGAEYIRIPLLCTATAGITHDRSMRRLMAKESRRIKEEFGSADNYMIAMYESILFQKDPQQKLAEFLHMLIEEEGCVLWHCSAGKDRAGVCAMLVEGILGVDEHIMELDYCLSDVFQRRKRSWQKIGMTIAPVSGQFKALIIAMMKAKRIYIHAILEKIKERYQSIPNYCKEALGITEEEMKALRDKYLEEVLPL